MSGPAVSVIIPTYNRPAYCVQAIESVLAQTFAAYELIVVDDGSSDSTPDMLARFGDRIRVIRQANAGVSAARNTGIQAARGRCFAFLDHDDLWMPEKLAVLVPEFEAAPEAGLIYSSVEHSLESGEPRTSDDASNVIRSGRLFREIFLRQVRISTSSILVRREAVDQVGGYDPALPVAQDYDFHLRIARRYPIVGVARALASVRFTPGSGGQNRLRAHRDVITVLERHWEQVRGTPEAPPEWAYRRLLGHRYFKLGKRLLSIGQVPEAREAFVRAWRLQPLSIEKAVWWGKAWKRSRSPRRKRKRMPPQA